MNVPKYMWAMLICTGLYLTIEIPYSIHLVSVLGGQPTQADIDVIEQVGRLLTGIAVALAYVGIVVYPKHYNEGYLFSTATRAALMKGIPLVFLVFGALHVYGETRSEWASGQARKDAYISTLAKRTLAEQGMLGITPSGSPSWLGLVSGLPAIYSSSKLVEMTGMNIEQLAMQEARRTLADVEMQHRNFIALIEDKAGSAYRTYSDASRTHADAMKEVNPFAEKKWAEYSSKIARKYGGRIPAVGSWDHSWAIKGLRNEGLPVSERFRLNDKATFVTLVKRQAIEKVSSQYMKAMDRHLPGARLKPGVSRTTFFNNPAIQDKIRKEMWKVSLPAGVVISPDMPLDVFASRIYPALVSDAYAKLLKDANQDADSFTRGSMDEVSDASMKATSLPATALLLSLAGALFHIYKFAGYLFTVFGHALRVKFLSSSTLKHVFAASLLVFTVNGMRDGVASASAGLIHDTDAGIYGAVVAEAVKLQPGMFTVGEIIGSVGAWPLISAILPPPRLPNGVDGFMTASTKKKQAPSFIPVPAEKPVFEVVDAAPELKFIPIPIPAPRD